VDAVDGVDEVSLNTHGIASIENLICPIYL